MTLATSVSDMGTATARPIEVGDAALDDRDLVLAFQDGIPTAFADIYRRYRPLAGHICYRMLGNAEDAEEAVQETMLRVFQGLPRFNGRYALQPWIARIARNVSLDVLRTRARRPQNGEILHELAEGGPGDTDQDPSELVERLIEGERVWAVLRDLPEHHRHALVLRELEGRSHQEIGEALGVSPSQAKALIHRAKGTFRRAWDRNGHERRGVAALVPFFLAPLRLPGFIRRLLSPVQEAATGAGSQAAASAGASPAVVAGATTAVERVTTAAVAVLMVGTVGVGAVAVHKARQAEPRKTPAPVVAPSVAPTQNEVAEPAPRKDPVPDRHAEKVRPAPTEAEESPAAEAGPSPTPSGTPTTDASVSPAPPPPPPPAPPWSLNLASSVPLGTFQPALISSNVQGNAGKELLFSQTVSGPTASPKGEIGHIYLEYWGFAHESRDGRMSMLLFIDTPIGRYEYEAEGALASVVEAEDGRVTYRFVADYDLEVAPAEPSPAGDRPARPRALPADGTVTLTLHFWVDRTTLYAVDLGLAGASPAA